MEGIRYTNPMSEEQPRRAYQRHPWDRWFSKKSFTLVKGKDFACQPHGMAQAVRNAAAMDKFRKSVSIHIEGETITVTVLGPAAPRKRKTPCPSPVKFPKLK